jgi:hypothetical protein
VIPGLIVAVLIVVFVVIVVTGGAGAKKQDQRYRSSLLGWATAHGWTYRDGDGPVTKLLPEAEWTSLLPKGDKGRGVMLQLDGTRQGRPLTVAHYWYQTTTSSSTSRDSDGHRRTSTTTHTHTLTVVVVRLAASYPAVALQRRGLGLGWGLAVFRALGRQPASLTGVEEFDRRYRIRTKAGGSSLVTPQVISAYLSSDLPPWQLSGDQLVITWPGTIKVDDLDRKVDQSLTVAGLLDNPPPQP